MLNPHVDNSCVLTLDEVAAKMLHNTLGEWLAGSRGGQRIG
jgi:cell pole-organizing protein PopZ